MSDPIKLQVVESTTFAALGVCEELCNACTALGWQSPSPIQKAAIPPALEGRDIIGLAQTGSGKTGAFALPIIQALLDEPRRLFAVVLAPTRELCVQIGEQFQALGAPINLEVASIVGGLDMVSQCMVLAKKPHVVVASPGRLLDHVENTKGFSLHSAKYLVLDEADRLLSMDFEEAIERLLEALPKERRTFLFSATMTARVSKLQKVSLQNPIRIEVSTKYETVDGLIQNYILIPHKYKYHYAYCMLDYYSTYSAMIFTNTCVTAKRLTEFFSILNLDSTCLNGKMTQPQRLSALGNFKSTKKKILVATEVGSRGLDIPSVDIVVNFDVPASSKDYIHRVGRTARAGRTGRAITIVTQYDIEAFQKIEQALGKKLSEFTSVTDTHCLSKHEQVIAALRESDVIVKEGTNKKFKQTGNESHKRYAKDSSFRRKKTKRW